MSVCVVSTKMQPWIGKGLFTLRSKSICLKVSLFISLLGARVGRRSLLTIFPLLMPFFFFYNPPKLLIIWSDLSSCFVFFGVSSLRSSWDDLALRVWAAAFGSLWHVVMRNVSRGPISSWWCDLCLKLLPYHCLKGIVWQCPEPPAD